MGHLLDHAAHAGNIENADIAIAEFRAVLHQYTITVVKLRLHALAADRNDFICGRNRVIVIQNARLAFWMVFPVHTVASRRGAAEIRHAVHSLQRHAEPAFMHIAAHGLGESFQIFLSVRVQRTVKIQKTLLALGQFAVFILYTEKFIQRDVQKQAKSAQRLSVRLSLVRFPVADGVLVDSHALREIALVVLCTGAIFADHIAKGVCRFLLCRFRLRTRKSGDGHDCTS